MARKDTSSGTVADKRQQRRSSIYEGNAVIGELGDIGNFDVPELGDIVFNLVDFLPSDEMEETRYILPHFVQYSEQDFVLYENAERLAKELKPISEGVRCVPCRVFYIWRFYRSLHAGKSSTRRRNDD